MVHKGCSVYMVPFILLLLFSSNISFFPEASEIPHAEFMEIAKAKSPSPPVDVQTLSVDNKPPIGVPVTPSPPDHIG